LLPIRDELSPGWRPLVDDVVLSRFLGFDDVHWVSVVVANGGVDSNIIQAFSDFFSHIFHNLRNGLLVKRLKVVRNGVTTPKGNIGLDVILDVREQAFEYELVGIAVVVTPLASGSLLSRRLTAICPAAEWLATIVVSSLSVGIIEMEVAKNDYLEELPSRLAEFWSILLVKLVHKVVIPELFGLLAEEIVDPVVHVNLLPVLHVANVENESAHILLVKNFFRENWEDGFFELVVDDAAADITVRPRGEVNTNVTQSVEEVHQEVFRVFVVKHVASEIGHGFAGIARYLVGNDD